MRKTLAGVVIGMAGLIAVVPVAEAANAATQTRVSTQPAPAAQTAAAGQSSTAAKSSSYRGTKKIKTSYRDGWADGKVIRLRNGRTRIEGIVRDRNCRYYGGSRVKMTWMEPGGDYSFYSNTACNNGRGFHRDYRPGVFSQGVKVQVCSTRPRLQCGRGQRFYY
ncbi:hypothetical protein GCM10010411_66520 [Actinomadura fulvescens]|uniref:Secreted protein n=2 Tax=Actinomadura fulvescens TaxID=46160 RepID=A0ABN3QAU8_9ACTN